jgi:hypothetical protein
MCKYVHLVESGSECVSFGAMLTRKEHLLFLAFFTKQQRHINIIVDMLRSRGILSGDDPAAFRFAASDASSTAALFSAVKADYLRLAKQLGVPLPNLETKNPLKEP